MLFPKQKAFALLELQTFKWHLYKETNQISKCKYILSMPENGIKGTKVRGTLQKYSDVRNYSNEA